MGARDKAYGEKILSGMKKLIPEDNQIIGSFICQGKIPMALKKRYEDALKKNPDDIHMKLQLENHEQSQSHPDKQDIEDAKCFAREMIERI